jgi:GNAT superfamily N-acetyltransferase
VVQIRAATASDIPALKSIFVAASLSNEADREILLANPDALELEEAPIEQGRAIVAAVEDGRVVAFATAAWFDEFLDIEDLFVHPDCMGQGIGSALVRDIVATARLRGAGRVEVTASDDALGFYRRLGFVVNRQVTTRFGPALRLHLDLSTAVPEGEVGLER